MRRARELLWEVPAVVQGGDFISRVCVCEFSDHYWDRWLTSQMRICPYSALLSFSTSLYLSANPPPPFICVCVSVCTSLAQPAVSTVPQIIDILSANDLVSQADPHQLKIGPFPCQPWVMEIHTVQNLNEPATHTNAHTLRCIQTCKHAHAHLHYKG